MLESKKQHVNVKNKDSPLRQKTITCCSKGWTNMRNDQSVKLKHICWDRKGCRYFVVGCRVTDEKASAVPGIFYQPEKGCHITSSVLPAAAGRMQLGLSSAAAVNLFPKPRSSDKEKALKKHHESGLLYKGCSCPTSLPRMLDMFKTYGYYTTTN